MQALRISAMNCVSLLPPKSGGKKTRNEIKIYLESWYVDSKLQSWTFDKEQWKTHKKLSHFYTGFIEKDS